MKHVELCTPEIMEPIVRDLYCTMGMYAVDFLRKKTPPVHEVRYLEIVRKLLEKKRGLIAILSHFGNWELLASLFGSEFSRLGVIAKTMNNPYINAWIEKKRTDSHVEVIYKEQALRKMLQVIAQNGTIAILIDQRGGHHGTESLFLDKPASTVKTVAGIVQKTGCPVVSAYSLMRDDLSYDIVIEEVPEIDTKGMGQEEAVKAHQELHNQILSSIIRKYPSHYFGWFHQRFKGTVNYRQPITRK
jgi:KDO2-lipid IV(A) lauroyltransferase